MRETLASCLTEIEPILHPVHAFTIIHQLLCYFVCSYQELQAGNIGKKSQAGVNRMSRSCSLSSCLTVRSQRFILQESLRARFWQLDKAGEERTSDNTKKTSSSSLRGIFKRKNPRKLLTVSEKLKLSVPCQELPDSSGQTAEVTLEDSASQLHFFSFLSHKLVFQKPRRVLLLLWKEDQGHNQPPQAKKTQPDSQLRHVPPINERWREVFLISWKKKKSLWLIH